LRAIMMSDEENRANWTRPELHHWAEREWKKFITPDNLADLKFWEPGTELPPVSLTNHLRAPPIRALQRFVHAFCLPMLDRIRRGFDPGATPQSISASVVRELQAELEALP